jgi:hypothetical protein
VSQIEAVVKELKQLPPAKLKEVADLVYRLRQNQHSERDRALSDTAGFMTPAEADAFQQTIEQAEA